MFDWLRGRPKACSGCGGEDRGIHRVYSGLAGGEETDQLCTSCLLARLEPQLRGGHVLFIEPHSCDSYVYSPIDAIDNPLARERTLLALASFVIPPDTAATGKGGGRAVRRLAVSGRCDSAA